MPPRRSTRPKRKSSQALESLVASPPRRRRTAAPGLPASGNDSETAAQSAVLLSGPSSHASEPAIPATGLVFPPALFDQLVPRVAAEITRQLQRAPLLPAVQEPQVPSPAALPSLARTTAVQQLTTKVPVASSSPVGNPCGQFFSCWQSLWTRLLKWYSLFTLHWQVRVHQQGHSSLRTYSRLSVTLFPQPPYSESSLSQSSVFLSGISQY